MEAGVGAASTSLGKQNLEAEISLDKWLSFRYWDVLNDKLVNPCWVYLWTVLKDIFRRGKRSGFLAGHSGYCSRGCLSWTFIVVQLIYSTNKVLVVCLLQIPVSSWPSCTSSCLEFLIFKHIRVLHLAFFFPDGTLEINPCISWCAGLCLVIVFLVWLAHLSFGECYWGGFQFWDIIKKLLCAFISLDRYFYSS